MAAWEGGIPVVDLVYDLHGTPRSQYAKKDLKDVGKAAFGASEATKEVARTIRRAGAYLATFDTHLGTLLFKYSRVAMTMGLAGVAMTGVGGIWQFIQSKAELSQELIEKQISTIMEAREEWKRYEDAISDPKKIAAMEAQGLTFDPNYIKDLQKLNEVSDAAKRMKEIGDAIAQVYTLHEIDVAGGTEKYNQSLDTATDRTLWLDSISQLNKMNDSWTDIDNVIGDIRLQLESFFGGFDTRYDSFESKSAEMIKAAGEKVKELDDSLEYYTKNNSLFDETARVDLEALTAASKKAHKYFDALVKLSEGDESQWGWLKENNYDIGTLEKLWMHDRARDKSLQKSADDVLGELKNIDKNTMSMRVAPTGVWSTNLQGGIPYTNVKVPVSQLTEGGALPTLTAPTIVNAGSGISSPSATTAAPASSGGGTVINITINNTINPQSFDKSTVDELVRQMADQLASQLSAYTNGRRRMF